MSRTVRVQVMIGLLAVIGVPGLAYGQGDFQGRFDRALAVFNSARQPEAIPQFSQLIDDLRTLPNRSAAQTTLLARALQYRAQARENVGQTADADADLRLIREVAPNFRLTDPGLSASLVGRFNALVPPPAAAPPPAPAAAPAPQAQPTSPPIQPTGTSSPKLITVSVGYQYLKESDCDECTYPAGFYADVAGEILPFLSWVGEVSSSSGTLDFGEGFTLDATWLLFGGGARVHPKVRSRLLPFGQLLVGGARISGNDPFSGDFSESKGAVHLGGGVDYLVTPRLGARFSVGYIKLLGDVDASVVRVAVGATIVVR